MLDFCVSTMKQPQQYTLLNANSHIQIKNSLILSNYLISRAWITRSRLQETFVVRISNMDVEYFTLCISSWK